MVRPLPHRALLLIAPLVLAACTTSLPTQRTWEGEEPDGATACDDVDADQCVVLACDEGECGIFSCEDVDPEALTRGPQVHEVELAQLHRPPFRGPGTQRNWRRAGLREGARPRMTFHFQYRQGFLPAFPRLDGKLVKHHLFPREQRLADWFTRQGINIHEWTILLPEQVHLRIHRGARGGPWNEAWRQFMRANDRRQVPPEELLRKAFELALRFDIAGPISPYYSPVPPPGPRLLAP